ncbi:MAG: 50S ribosomal protein L18 [Patescibacteria group bacterium]
MNNISRNNSRLHRKKRVRAKVSGTAICPRLSVFKSLFRMEVQVIDDKSGKTVLSLDSKKLKLKNDISGALELGKKIAQACQEKKIAQIVFDRSGYKYHGKVKALAEGAREGGLKF